MGSRSKDCIKRNNQTQRRRRAGKILELKKLGHCLDCGNDDYRLLTFHHRDPALKLFEISSGATKKGWAVLMREVDKCDLLCANCHTLRHWEYNEE